MPKKTTTHTVEMTQIDDLNRRLGEHLVNVTASDLGLQDAAVRGTKPGLGASAMLVRVSWDGAPEFPYIHGHFSSTAQAERTQVVDLHTAALTELSHLLHAHHVWGYGSIVEVTKP